MPSAESSYRRTRSRGEPRQDHGATPEKTRSDGGRDFAPAEASTFASLKHEVKWPPDWSGDVVERAAGVLRDEGADNRLVCCLADIPDKQAAALVAMESLNQRTSYSERGLDRVCFLKHLYLEARRRVNDERGAVGIRIYLRATDCGRDAIVLPEEVPG